MDDGDKYSGGMIRGERRCLRFPRPRSGYCYTLNRFECSRSRTIMACVDECDIELDGKSNELDTHATTSVFI